MLTQIISLMRKYLFHIPYLACDNYSDNGYWHHIKYSICAGTKACEIVSFFRKANIVYFNLVIEYLCLVSVYYCAVYYCAVYQAIVYKDYVLLLHYIQVRYMVQLVSKFTLKHDRSHEHLQNF